MLITVRFKIKLCSSTLRSTSGTQLWLGINGVKEKMMTNSRQGKVMMLS